MSSKAAALSDSSDSENEKKILAQLRKDNKKSSKRKSAGPAPGEPATKSAGKKSSSQGEEKISIGKMKFVTVREFKGKLYVDIREHYEKDGELLPGKKGVSLPAEQWQNLKAVIDDIDQKLWQKS